MSGHTPGVWIAHANGEWFHIKAHTDALVAVVAKCESVGPENEANARLIAAAPEMLEALKKALDILISDGCGDDIADQIEAIIAKAEGRQP